MLEIGIGLPVALIGLYRGENRLCVGIAALVDLLDQLFGTTSQVDNLRSDGTRSSIVCHALEDLKQGLRLRDRRNVASQCFLVKTIE